MLSRSENTDPPREPDALIQEAWSQGFLVGALVILACITLANMRRGVLLHKLILIEILFGLPHGTFIFPSPPVYSYYLSATGICLQISWCLHNVVAWMKNRPFLGRIASLSYIGTVVLSFGYWITECYARFAFFGGKSDLFVHLRPYEALFRDPWWVFTTVNLIYNIKRKYNLSITTIIRVSPRFGVLLVSMCTSLAFSLLDILSVTKVIPSDLPVGLNPYWKLGMVFKLLTDAIVLDDFKTALDKLSAKNRQMLAAETGSELGQRLTHHVSNSIV